MTEVHVPEQHSDASGDSDSPEPIADLTFRFMEADGPVYSLNNFGCEVATAMLLEGLEDRESSGVHEGALIGPDGQSHSISFRIRSMRDAVSRCSFHDLSIKQRREIELLHRQVTEVSSDDGLQDLSYDQLAEGGKSKSDPATPAKAKGNTKALAAMVLLACMVGIGLWVLMFVRARSTIRVNSSVMVGNYLPVSAPVEGELTEVLVKEGDVVRKGQVLARLFNREKAEDHEIIAAQLQTARKELAAQDQMIKDFEVTLKISKLQLDQKIAVAKAELKKAESDRRTAQLQIDRLRPLMNSRNMPQADYDEAVSIEAGMAAELFRHQAMITALEASRQAADSNMLVTEHSVSNPLSELQARRDVAAARVIELETTLAIAQKRSQAVELLAPCDGAIYAVYCHPGEVLKVADETLAMTTNDGGWAAGHIPAEESTAVRPGQPVEIEIPALELKAAGSIAAVGHRAVYARGHYNGDFRAAPTDVPIKVVFDEMPGEIPSGMRLDMVVRVNDHFAWLNDWLGEEPAADVVPDSEQDGPDAVAERAGPEVTMK